MEQNMISPPKTWRIVFILLLLSIALPVQALERGPQGTIRVGIFHVEPFNIIDKDKIPAGLNVDLLKEISRGQKWTPEFVPVTWVEGLERLQKEEIDLMVSVAYSPERAEVMDYNHESVLELWGQVFLRPDGKVKNMNDLAGHRVGVMRKDINGSNFIKTAQSLGVQCEIIEFPSYLEVFTAVQKNEVDAGIAHQHYGLRYAKEYNLVGSTILFSPFSIYFAAKKGKHHELLGNIDTQLFQWKRDKDSYFYERLDYWLGGHSNRTKIPAWLIYAAIVVAVFMLMLVGFTLLLKKTVRLRTEELRESEVTFRKLFEDSSDPILLINSNGVFVECNQSALDLLKMTREQFLLLPPARISPEFQPDGRRSAEAAPEMIALAYSKGLHRFDWTCVNAQGGEFIVEVSLMPLTIKGQTMLHTTWRDITERKQAEKDMKTLQAHLHQAQKMEAIGTLAGGIAHDFNNILGAILGYAELAQEDSPVGSEVRGDIDQVVRASHRAKELVKQILAFSRQDETKNIPLQPAIIIKEAMKMLRASLPSTIDIQQDIDSEGGFVLADPTQIHQVMVNLCTNAFHAMEETGGTLRISLKKTSLSQNDLASEPHVQPGDFVQLSIGDTGPGIPPEIREKIFDPYFTTKEVGKGTGMGLAIIHGIVKSYKGLVSCHSQSGEGTVFHVYLPVIADPALLESETAPLGLSQLGNERILFIDDEEILAEMGKVMLERLGYRVTVRRNSLEALNTFQNHPEQFDLIITDQTMPGMTGSDLSRRILQIRPGMPIILCTGYSSLITEDKAKSLGIKGFAMKPLAKKDIAAIIKKVLDEVP